MNYIYKGNAALDGKTTRQWIVGAFMPDDDIRKTEDVEIKWGVHAKGESRTDWAAGDQRTSVCILVSGKFSLEFPNEQAELNKQGDYVMWGTGVNHRWRALEDSVVITIRWK